MIFAFDDDFYCNEYTKIEEGKLAVVNNEFTIDFVIDVAYIVSAYKQINDIMKEYRASSRSVLTSWSQITFYSTEGYKRFLYEFMLCFSETRMDKIRRSYSNRYLTINDDEFISLCCNMPLHIVKKYIHTEKHWLGFVFRTLSTIPKEILFLIYRLIVKKYINYKEETQYYSEFCKIANISQELK